jgi:hypothetical protein
MFNQKCFYSHTALQAELNSNLQNTESEPSGYYSQSLRIIFSSLITRHLEANEPLLALDKYRSLCLLDIVPFRSCLSGLLSACCVHNLDASKEVLQIWNQRCSFGKPSLENYFFALEFLRKNHSYSSYLKVLTQYFNDYADSKIFHHDIWRSMAQAIMKFNAQVDLAQVIETALKNSSFEEKSMPPAEMLLAKLSLLTKSLDLKNSFLVFSQIRSSTQRKVKKSPKATQNLLLSYKFMIKLITETSNFEELNNLYFMFEEDGLTPDSHFFIQIFKACSKFQNLMLMLYWEQKARDIFGRKLPVTLYPKLLDFYSHCDAAAASRVYSEVFSLLQEGQMEKSIELIASMKSCWFTQKKLPVIEKILDQKSMVHFY